MKFSSSLAMLGTVSLAVAAQPHRHAHRHADKHLGAPAERRAETTTWVPVVEYVYELDGHELAPADVEKGIKDGIYVLISDPPTPTPTPTPSSVKPAEFFQKTSSSTSAPPPPPTTSSTSSSSTSTPPPPPPTTSSTSTTPLPTSTAKPPAASSSSSGGGSTSGGQGLNSKFISGTVKCSDFPSSYGPIAVDYLNLGGYTGIQKVPGYSAGAGSISDIITLVSGMGGCQPGCFCSYACPAGYQKLQWPTSQGATGQSVGGLLCNSEGFLELTNPNYDTLCGAGTGEVEVTNKLTQNVAICRTDYPGTESETVPLNTQPGQTYELTCPDANTYYKWGDKPTSAQYYVNPAGTPVNVACQWGSSGSQTGNWAPLNIGIGKGAGGETFISMFWNKPTNPNPSLDFNVKITGGISGSCELKNNVFYSNGAPSASGCTVSVSGVATYEFY